ncbi:putative glutathione S-transferase GSTF1 [Carex rostrata]
MKVFGPPKLTNVARVLVCLEEVGAEYEVVPIDFFAGQHKSPAHVARHPFGQIPAFQDDDFTIFESRAISRYILKKYKSDLLPEDDLKKATLVDVWLNVEYGQYNQLAFVIIKNVIVNPMRGEAIDQQAVDTSVEKLKKMLEVYDTRLSQCKYLAGDFISFADLSHFSSTYYLMLTHGSVFDSYPHVKAWWEAFMARPSIKKVVEIMSN